MTEYWKAFFESYIAAGKAAYDIHFRICSENDGSDSGGDDVLLQELLNKEYEKWLRVPLKALGDKTPVAFVEEIGSFDEIASAFNYGTAACDDEMPEVLVDKLRSFGEQAVDFLIGTACGKLPNEAGQDIIPQITAVKLLGRWKAEEAAEPLLNVLDKEHEAYELICETITDALTAIGSSCIDAIIRKLDEGVVPDTAKEYLLIALAELAKNNRSDKAYARLKKSFREMPDKSVPATCLANYGDGRAIPALRGYLEKNIHNIDKDTFYDVAAAVSQLGGKTDDLRYHN